MGIIFEFKFTPESQEGLKLCGRHDPPDSRPDKPSRISRRVETGRSGVLPGAPRGRPESQEGLKRIRAVEVQIASGLLRARISRRVETILRLCTAHPRSSCLSRISRRVETFDPAELSRRGKSVARISRRVEMTLTTPRAPVSPPSVESQEGLKLLTE